ncbi:MerR family transcriptional regulator [soil metagenome]
MRYTVKKLADLSSISVRTLHYYDEIGLLEPSYVALNGYRYYEEAELLKLQQILFFKELDFNLEDIVEMLSSPGFKKLEALEDQKKLLEGKRKRLRKLIITIEKTIETLKGDETMNANNMFDAFTDEELEKLKEETKEKWGETDAYKQSIERTKYWTKADYDRIKEEGIKCAQKLAEAMNLDVKSPEVQSLIHQHHQGIEIFYDCSVEMYRGLGQMYVSDKRFTIYYDKFKPGLAAWLQKAIEYYCDTYEKK